MATRKKRILWHSDPATHPTGFGNYTKFILSYLYRTGKYEIANFACGFANNDNNHLKFPWRTYPAIPVDRHDIINRANQDPNFGRMLSYGEPLLEEVVKDFKPDVYIGVQDWWGAPDFAVDKKFWNKINCIAYWTADSLPLLESAVQKAHKVKNHYVWASFAEKEFHRMADELEAKLPTMEESKRSHAKEQIEGWRRVKTLSGCVNEKSFFRLPENKRAELRLQYGIELDTFVVSTGSRNQLRKLFPQTIEAFAQFKKQHPELKTKLLLYTDVNEGWTLIKHAKEQGLKEDDLLLPYRCRVTGEIFYLAPRTGDFDNPRTGEKNSVRCVGIGNFAPESTINDFLNLADVFVLCITSGGFELFLSQAKLTEIPTIANEYSCFEEQCGADKGTLIADQNFTYEVGTDFKKAAVFPFSIVKGLNKVLDLSVAKRRELGRAGKEFVLRNYSIEVVAKQWEKILDKMPEYEGEYNFWDTTPNNPEALIPENSDESKFIESLYQLILCREPDHEGFTYWKEMLAQAVDKNESKNKMVDYFRHVAREHNKQLPAAESPEQYLRRIGVKENAVLVVFQKSAGDCVMLSGLFRSLREQYPNNQLVISVEPAYRDIFQGNPYIDLIIDFQPWFDQQSLLQGQGRNKPLVFKSLHPRNGVQIGPFDFLGKDNLNLKLQYEG